MNKESKDFFLYVSGQKIPVSEQVFKEYQHYERKERYFLADLKVEGFDSDQKTQTAVFTPSREDSYDRLLEQDQQFTSSDSESVEDAAIKAILIEQLYHALNTLSRDELTLIYEVFFLHHTMRQISKKMNVSVGTVSKRKMAVLRKLRKLVE